MARQPPDVVAAGVFDLRECDLRALTLEHLQVHHLDERVKGVERRAGARRAQPVIQRLLADDALRAVENREHGIHVQVVPRAVVERWSVFGGRGTVVVNERGKVAIAIDEATPLGPESLEHAVLATPAQRPDHTSGHHYGQSRPQEAYDRREIHGLRRPR